MCSFCRPPRQSRRRSKHSGRSWGKWPAYKSIHGVLGFRLHGSRVPYRLVPDICQRLTGATVLLEMAHDAQGFGEAPSMAQFKNSRFSLCSTSHLTWAPLGLRDALELQYGASVESTPVCWYSCRLPRRVPCIDHPYLMGCTVPGPSLCPRFRVEALFRVRTARVANFASRSEKSLRSLWTSYPHVL